MLSDSVGTVAGAMMGTTTVTSYVESGAGVKAGGKLADFTCNWITVFSMYIFCSFGNKFT